jgi:hypothetical protein
MAVVKRLAVMAGMGRRAAGALIGVGAAPPA